MTLFIQNLPYATNKRDLDEILSQYGDVDRISLLTDRETGRSRGCAFAHFRMAEDAERALESLDCCELDGRVIHVEPARPRGARP